MKIRMAIALPILVISMLISARGYADTFSMQGRTKIAKSGNSVVTKESSYGKVEVVLETALVEGDCLKALPAINSSKEYSAEGSVVRRLSISIAGKSIRIPTATYSGLFNPMWASINYKNNTFDLSINEGVDLYLIHVYFNSRRGVFRMTVYDYLARKLVEDAHFYPAVVELN